MIDEKIVGIMHFIGLIGLSLELHRMSLFSYRDALSSWCKNDDLIAITMLNCYSFVSVMKDLIHTAIVIATSLKIGNMVPYGTIHI